MQPFYTALNFGPIQPTIIDHQDLPMGTKQTIGIRVEPTIWSKWEPISSRANLLLESSIPDGEPVRSHKSNRMMFWYHMREAMCCGHDELMSPRDKMLFIPLCSFSCEVFCFDNFTPIWELAFDIAFLMF